MTGIRVTILSGAGSTPRDAGTQMFVHAHGIQGTIGGGALEWEAMRCARQMLADGTKRSERKIALGPALGQCCGGAVSLLFEQADGMITEQGTPLWIWGAGHVGRALVNTLHPLPDFQITWVDTDPARFPDMIPDGVTQLIAAEPARAMTHAPQEADHLIATYSHEIDFALCHGALVHGFASCGVIGSETKWARFTSRLRKLGHCDAQISSIRCPIGLPNLGKHPQAIAVGVASRLLNRRMRKNLADGITREGMA